MSNIHIQVSGADAAVVTPGTLTAGMVGAAVTFTFSGSAWQELTKIAVFRAGDVRRDVADWDGDACVIPWECLRSPGEVLLAGVYGADSTGAVVIPTVYADCGVIQPGADPAGDTSAQPTEPFFAALMEQTLAQAKASGLFDGRDGTDGANGKDGTDGRDGVDGKDGTNGVDGQNGADGQDGFSPTVTLTSTLATGMIPATKVTITDKDGDHEFTVKDGKAGAKGGTGIHGDSVALTVSVLDGDTAHPNGGYQLTIRRTTYPASGGQATVSTEQLQLWHGSDGVADVSMGVTGAEVGQALCVAAVDENGVPAAWEVM